MDKFTETAAGIIENVGGKENIAFCIHCVTRVRLTLKDKSLVNLENLKNLNGAMGAQWSGDQLQVIIGATVDKVYTAVCDLAGISPTGAIDENLDSPKLDSPKKDFSVKGILDSFMNALSGTIAGIIPAFIAFGMLMFVNNIFGPTLLKLYSAESNLYQLFNSVATVGLSSLPLFVAYSGSRKFNCNPIVALLIAAFMMSTEYNTLAAAGNFTVYGIPMIAGSYASQVFPMFLITWCMGYVEKLIKKYLPEALQTFEPFIVLLIMLPIALCGLGPLGTIIGSMINNFLVWAHNVFGPLGIALIGALWIPLTGTGMHVPVIATAVVAFSTYGFDNTVLVGGLPSVYAIIAVDLVYVLRAKTAEDRALGVSCLATQTFVGLGEPSIFGILFRNKNALLVAMASTFVGALYAGFMKCAVYMLPISNALVASVFAGGGSSHSLIHGCIACGITFVTAFILMMVVGFGDKKKA